MTKQSFQPSTHAAKEYSANELYRSAVDEARKLTRERNLAYLRALLAGALIFFLPDVVDQLSAGRQPLVVLPGALVAACRLLGGVGAFFGVLGALPRPEEIRLARWEVVAETPPELNVTAAARTVPSANQGSRHNRKLN